MNQLNAYPRVIRHLRKWIVPQKAKRNLRLELNFLGVKHMSLFPDLTGVASTIVAQLIED